MEGECLLSALPCIQGQHRLHTHTQDVSGD